MLGGMEIKPTPSDEGGPAGTLSPFIPRYMALIEAQGYARRSQRYHQTLLDHFDAWLARRQLSLDRINEELVEEFLDPLVRAKWVHVSAPATMRRLVAMLREAGVTAPPVIASTPIDRVMAQYERFLVEERALSPATAAGWILLMRRLLSEKFGDDPVTLDQLSANDVIAFVQRHARRHGPSYTRRLVVSSRSFLRYLHYKGMHPQDLAVIVPKVARWSLSALPKHLPADQVRRMLKACDQRTSLGRRNYAILLLLARLGLRAGEVIRLQLDDIDWEQHCLMVRGKAGRMAQLPLPSDVARATARYLKRDRPRCGCRALFIRDYAPVRGLTGATAVSKIVRCALKKAEVKSARAGAHLLRHSLATDMLRRGASLDEIGEILRHRSADTTAIYAKVDLNALRALALAWPGGAQ